MSIGKEKIFIFTTGRLFLFGSFLIALLTYIDRDK